MGVEVIQRVIEFRGKPECIRTDNGTEFMAKAFRGFCNVSSIQHLRIQKGKPTQNAYIERFNRSYREDVLDAFIFGNENTKGIFNRKKLMKNSIFTL